MRTGNRARTVQRKNETPHPHKFYKKKSTIRKSKKKERSAFFFFGKNERVFLRFLEGRAQKRTLAELALIKYYIRAKSVLFSFFVLYNKFSFKKPWKPRSLFKWKMSFSIFLLTYFSPSLLNVHFRLKSHRFFTVVKNCFFTKTGKQTQGPLGALCSTPFLSGPLFLLFAFEPCEHGPQFLEHKILQRVINLKCCFFVWPIRGFSAAKNRGF